MKSFEKNPANGGTPAIENNVIIHKLPMCVLYKDKEYKSVK